MTGNAFVISERRHAPFRHFIHVTQVREENSRPASILSARLIMRPGCCRFAKRLDAADVDLRFRRSVEKMRFRFFNCAIDQTFVFGERFTAGNSNVLPGTGFLSDDNSLYDLK